MYLIISFLYLKCVLCWVIIKFEFQTKSILLSMKKLICLLILATIIASCGSKKGFLERSNPEKALQDAIKALNKNPSDESAKTAIPELYNIIKTKHLDNINALGYSTQMNKWESLVNEYQQLQSAYEGIMSSAYANKLVSPVSFNKELIESREAAANEYYKLGANYMKMPGRENAKMAYAYFKKCMSFSPGYKDAGVQMQIAFEKAIVNVVISPVQDNSYFSNNGLGNYGYNYSDEYYQRNIINDLNYNNIYAARFFTLNESRRMNIRPDWVVEFRLRNLDVPPPVNIYSSRTASKKIQIGTDTIGKPLYNTVYATINITTSSFTAKADMDMNITETDTRRSVSFRSFRETYKWEQQTATFSGDKRALSNADWTLISNSGLNSPRKEEVLVELYKKIYPQVLSNIRQAVSW